MSFLSLSALAWFVVDLLIELLERDFFLGDHVHRAANLRIEIADHLLRAVDLELDRHAVRDRAGQAVVRRRDVAGRIAAEQHQRGQAQARSPPK